MALCHEAHGRARVTTWARCSKNDEQGCSNVAKGRTTESDQGHSQVIKKNPQTPKGTWGVFEFDQNLRSKFREYLMKPKGILKCDQNSRSEVRKYPMNLEEVLG